MKRLKTILILIIAAMLGGCNLLGNQKPQQSIPFKGNLNTGQKLQGALTGAYNDLQELQPSLQPGDNFGEVVFSNDIITNDAVYLGSFPTYQEIAQQHMTTTNGSIQTMWNGAYVDINDCNIILKQFKTQDYPKLSEKQKNNIKGQALYIRSLQYYYLLNLFALPASAGESNMGVPLQLKAVTSSNDFKKPSRSSIAEVYKQITADLDSAQALLPSVSGGNPRDHANKEAATALLARIALVRGNYQKAAVLSKKVIDSGNFSLEPDVTDYFTKELGQESIFEIQNTSQDSPDAGNSSLSQVYNIDGRDDIQVGPEFVQALHKELSARQKAALKTAGATAVDTRKTELVVGKDSTGNIIYHANRNDYKKGASNSNKYEDAVNSSDNVPIQRYSAILMTRAEALARMNGINKESIKWLNKVRERAIKVTGGPESLIDYEKKDFASKQELITTILRQRHIELAFEGHYKTLLERTKQNVRNLPYNSPKLVFPIPQQQIEANKNIKQNPGYGG